MQVMKRADGAMGELTCQLDPVHVAAACAALVAMLCPCGAQLYIPAPDVAGMCNHVTLI